MAYRENARGVGVGRGPRRTLRGLRRRWCGACASVAAFVVLLVSGSGSASAQVLQEQWVRVQQSLATEQVDEALARVDGLEEVATSLQVRRMTPYAEALVAWSQAHADTRGWEVVARARKLDPLLPSALFLEARWSWQERDYFAAVGSYLAGLWNLVRFDRSRAVLGASALLCLTLAVAMSLSLVVVLQAFLRLRQIGHDATELGLLLFGRVNAVVFAAVIVLLPFFAGFGPVWLVAYIFVLGWSYMKLLHRVLGVVTLCLLALVPPALDVWQSYCLRQPAVSDRVGRMLEQRRLDFSTLREFSEFESEMGEVSNFNLILGELLRLHGEMDQARLHFQKAALGGPARPDAHLFLGGISMEEGDIPRAIQYYNQALDINNRSALAYLDLSFAYDQSRRFQEGDEARRTAREIVGRGTSSLGLPGSDPRIRYPRLGKADVESMVRGLPRDLRLAVGEDLPRLRGLRGLLSPFSLAMLCCCIVGCIILAIRHSLMWTSSVCTRCGKVFCPRCKSSTESMSYCSQCISVFLKRDVVSIDQQTVKLRQIRRWELLSTTLRRGVGLLFPGNFFILSGKIVAGQLISGMAMVSLVFAVGWLPLFMPSAEPLAAILPLQIACLVVLALLWLHSALASWYGR